MRAALKVARASAAEEQRRRQALEDKFDAGLAEAIGKARAVSVYSAAASCASSTTDTPRLLSRQDVPSPSSARGRGDGEGELAGEQMNGEAVGEKAGARGPDGGDGWGGKSSVAGVSDDGGGGGVSSLEKDDDGHGEQEQPGAAGKERGGAQEEEGEEGGDAGEKEQRLEALVTAAEAAVERTRAAAAVKEEENQERGCAEGGLDWVVDFLCVPVSVSTSRADRSFTPFCLP